MMKRKLILLLLTAVAAIGAHAQTKLILHQKTGGDIEIAFSDKPVATFEGETMIVKTSRTQFSFPLSNLGETTYEENGTTAIIETVTQLSPDAGPSCIYDLDGYLVKTVPAGEPVSFGTLQQGIYIIKNNNSSYKINRR